MKLGRIINTVMNDELKDVTGKYLGIDFYEIISKTLGTLDEEKIEDTFTFLLGYDFNPDSSACTGKNPERNVFNWWKKQGNNMTIEACIEKAINDRERNNQQNVVLVDLEGINYTFTYQAL